MRHTFLRVTAAAVLILAIGGLVSWLYEGTTTPAFADFVNRIVEVRTAKFKMIGEANGRPQETHEGMFLAPNGFRVEGPKMVIIGRGEKAIFLNRKEKRALVADFVNRPRDMASRNMFAELQEHLLQARDVRDVKREALGERDIDGRRAVGYRLTTADRVTILWGDPKTALPIRVETTFVAMPEGSLTMTDFAFNVPLDESLFSLEPPEGYTVSRNQMDASPLSEKDLIESLRCYSDLCGGAFPDAFVLNDKTANLVMEKFFAKKGWKIEKGTKPSQEQLRTMLPILSGIARGFGFAAETLHMNADAHYAGKGVSLGTPNTPIFWYRPKDSKQYHVIYADLSVHQSDTPPNVPNAQPVPSQTGKKH